MSKLFPRLFSPVEKNVGALLDFFLQSVIEAVMHPLHKFLVGKL